MARKRRRSGGFWDHDSVSIADVEDSVYSRERDRIGNFYDRDDEVVENRQDYEHRKYHEKQLDRHHLVMIMGFSMIMAGILVFQFKVSLALTLIVGGVALIYIGINDSERSRRKLAEKGYGDDY
jgi:uncharacterized membrane protein YiaA